MMTVATFCYFALYQEACDMRVCYGMVGICFSV